MPGRFAEFYLPEADWPPVFMQGDVLEDVPRAWIASPGAVPRHGTHDDPVVGSANYYRTQAMIISATCNIMPGKHDLVQLARVGPLVRPKDKELKSYEEGKHYRLFLLRDHPKHELRVVYLTDVWTLTLEHIAGLSRNSCLTDWARSLLSSALINAYARPITDPSYEVDRYRPFVPAPSCNEADLQRPA